MKWPYTPVELTRRGTPAYEEQIEAALDLPAVDEDPRVTDVLVLAHGWNNDLTAAEQLFTELCDNAADLLAERGETGRRFAVVGVLWPSMRWADEGQVAGGGLAAGGELPALLDAIDERVEDPAIAAELAGLAGRLETSADARREFVARLRTLLPDGDLVADDDPLPPALRSGDPQELFDRAAEAERALDDDPSPDGQDAPPPADDLPPGLFADHLADPQGAAAGIALGDLNPMRLARRLLNTSTYYTMKARAGDVGQRGVVPLLAQLHERWPGVRLHLAGHSFGGRVVTMAASAGDVPIASLTLLQAAFSHHGFSASNVPPGAFRRVLDGGRLRGPVVVTHTHNDTALRLAYAIASRLAGHVAAGIGDYNDPYGGIGANGAVATDEVQESALGAADVAYTFPARRIINLRADRQITGHADVRNPAVANALLQAMLAGR